MEKGTLLASVALVAVLAFLAAPTAAEENEVSSHLSVAERLGGQVSVDGARRVALRIARQLTAVAKSRKQRRKEKRQKRKQKKQRRKKRRKKKKGKKRKGKKRKGKRRKGKKRKGKKRKGKKRKSKKRKGKRRKGKNKKGKRRKGKNKKGRRRKGKKRKGKRRKGKKKKARDDATIRRALRKKQKLAIARKEKGTWKGVVKSTLKREKRKLDKKFARMKAALFARLRRDKRSNKTDAHTPTKQQIRDHFKQYEQKILANMDTALRSEQKKDEAKEATKQDAQQKEIGMTAGGGAGTDLDTFKKTADALNKKIIEAAKQRAADIEGKFSKKKTFMVPLSGPPKKAKAAGAIQYYPVQLPPSQGLPVKTKLLLANQGHLNVNPTDLAAAKTLNKKLKNAHREFVQKHKRDCAGHLCPLVKKR